MDIVVLDKDLERIGVIDYCTSVIWANRYEEVGDCELYVRATSEAIDLLRTGYYLTRDDDDMVCQIRKIEIDTDVENSNYLIVTGIDVKGMLDQRIIWGTRNCDGNVEEFIRSFVNGALGDPTLSARQMRKANGGRLFYLGYKSGFPEVIQEQVSYANVGDKVRSYCLTYGWGYKVILRDNAFYFSMYKGVDRSDEVIFSNDYENLRATKYREDYTNIANVALVGGEGEGSERTKNVSGYAEGTERFEIFVDAKDISKTITWGDLIALYPTKEQGGVGSIQQKGTAGNYYWAYEMDYIDIAVVDGNQLTELISSYPNGDRITKDGNLYYRIYNAVIADLPGNTLENNDAVVLRDVVYSVYLLNRGYENMADYGSVVTFEGSVEPDITFSYKRDYNIGDMVTVENEYGISVTARIVEVIETYDDNGYSIEPRFEYMEVMTDGRSDI